MIFAYVLRSTKDNKRYIGISNNLDRRLREHNQGLVKATKNRGPFKVIHFEQFNNYADARKREKFFKSGKGREFLKKINH